MKVVVQRVKWASVKVDNAVTGKIDRGYLLLVGFNNTDDENVINYIIRKIINLRIFEDENGKMNRSILDINGEILSVSQFTLYADCRKGNRPSFIDAAPAETAIELYELFNRKLSEQIHVEKGIFQADMKVELLNDGPVTIVLDSDQLIR